MASKGKKSVQQKLMDVVDKLGYVKGIIAELTLEEKDLKQVIINSELKEINGAAFRATVSRHHKSCLDPERVKLFLTDEQYDACLKQVEMTTVRVVARRRV